jgi:hypothetical protein
MIPKISYTHTPGIKQDIIRPRNRWKDQLNSGPQNGIQALSPYGRS